MGSISEFFLTNLSILREVGSEKGKGKRVRGWGRYSGGMGALIVSDGVDVDDGGDHDEGNDAEEELQAFFESATEDEGIETALLEERGAVLVMMVVVMVVVLFRHKMEDVRRKM